MTPHQTEDLMNDLPVQSVRWKRLAVICFFSGAGFAIVLAAIAGATVWYNSRPSPPKPWSTNAIIAAGPPSFGASIDGKSIEFSYSLLNATSTDYKIDSDSEIKLMVKLADGTFTPPLSKESASVTFPVFIPAGQKAMFLFSFTSSDIPVRNNGETDEIYHERLRTYLDHAVGGIASFAVFDGANRYQINLPRWLSKQPTGVK